ncbi:(ABC) transporter, partial [Quaeritorhiza haematococci]
MDLKDDTKDSNDKVDTVVAVPPDPDPTDTPLAKITTEEGSKDETIKEVKDSEGKESVGKKDDKDDKAAPKKTVSFFQLFRLATPFDKLLIAIGSLCAAANGAAIPLMTVLLGDLIFSLVIYPANKLTIGEDAAKERLDKDINTSVIYFVLLGVAVWFISWCQMCFWMWSGENQVKRIRERYFEAILRQDIGWFDSRETGDLTSRLISDTALIQEAISEKMGMNIQFIVTFLAGFVIAFVKGWQLALVICAVIPILAVCGLIMSKTLASRSTQGQDAYAAAGAIAQQVLSSMRTVVSFGGEKRAIQQYRKGLDEAEKIGVKKGLVTGAGVASVLFVMFGSYALAFWFGSTLIPQVMNGGQVLTVFFALVIGASSLGNIGPNMSAIGNGQGAAYSIFETIDRASPIDSLSTQGKKPESVQGNIEFRDVSFHYPSRPDVQVLEDFTLSIPVGKTIALVGASGSGKSTIVKLIERFYDATEGIITLDGTPISELNAKWLREQIGIVSQEPVLFDTSIRQNLLYGLKNSGEGMSKKDLDALIER